MKRDYVKILCVSILCLMVATVGFAQEDRTLSSAAGDIYVISAKAGGVNYVEGRVSVERSTGESGYLVKGDRIEAGDKVTTATNSRVEVMMNPGSFVRLNQNSEFEFKTTTLDDLTLMVNRGSAIFEVYASNDFKVTVTTPRAKFYLVNTGVYRVDVLADGIGKIEIYKGKAQIGNLSATTIEKGKTATVDGDQITVSKFNRKDMDDFEDWSKDRAKLIAKANEKLSVDKLNNSLLGTNRRYNCYDSYGLWVYSPRYSSYSFLPFGSSWRSPYGYGFNRSTSICDYPYYRNDRPRYRRYPSTGGSGGGTSTNTVPAANVERRNRNGTPPFRRMENSGNANVKRSRRSRFPNYPTGGSTRTRSVPRTIVTAPAAPKTPSTPPLSNPKGRGN